MSTRVELLELRFQHSAKFWIAIIFAIGLIVRVSLILLTLHNIDFARAIEAEPYKIALSLVNNGTYADAYGHGVGPTAHTAPLLPIILAIIINVAGVGLAADEPLGERRMPLKRVRPLLKPEELFRGQFAPEFFGFFRGLLIERPVFVQAFHMGAARKLTARWINVS